MPMDSRLVIGQLCDPKWITNLENINEVEYPAQLADQKLQKLILSRYKLTGVLKQMEGFFDKKDDPKLDGLRTEIKKLGGKIGKAAEDLVKQTIKGMKKKKKLRAEQGQKAIELSIESPVNFTLSAVENFPLAFDGMEFDVQYFKSDINDQKETVGNTTGGRTKADQGTGGTKADQGEGGTKAVKADGGGTKAVKADGGSGDTLEDTMADKVSKFVSNFISDPDTSSGISGTSTIPADKTDTNNMNQNAVMSTHSSMEAQTSAHTITGTLVIVAKCTHQNADILSPCILDSSKLMSAWNYTYPKNKLSYSGKKLFDLVFDEEKNPPKKGDDALHLITGCTRGSCFIGMAYTMKRETTKSSQDTAGMAETIKNVVNKDAMIGARTGQVGKHMANAAATINKMFSQAQVFNHCSLVTEGIIPNIAASEISTTVKEMSPQPTDLLAGLSAVKEAGDTAVNPGPDKAMQTAKTGAKFMEQSHEFAANTVHALSEKEAVSHQVIDTNSLMTAFTDYITKAQAGECGTPINFFLQKINKYDVAKAHLRTAYPTGSADSETSGADQASKD